MLEQVLTEHRTALHRQPHPEVSAVKPIETDAELMARHLSGDDDAFIELFNRLNHKLYLFSLKILRSPNAAEDIVQEVWEKVILLRRSGQMIQNPGGFCMRIVRNLCLNAFRRQKKFLPLTANIEEMGIFQNPMKEADEMSEHVLSSLDTLSFEHREILVLQAYCGYHLDEIAGMIGISKEAVWKRASRARKKLRTRVLESMSDN